jgi:regulator of PEP synthase PpsR (kinase-PPPase family)
MKRTAFFISDSTGITAETLGRSLLAQFDNIEFEKVVLPFIDTVDKALVAIDRINEAARRDGIRPIIFDTVVNEEIRHMIAGANAVLMDIFSTFLVPLERELGTQSNLAVGRGHSAAADLIYQKRISAVQYALDNDDGARINRYDQAQLILVGVSRSGKTPTCLYMAMQHGVYAANYPLTEEDLDSGQLPKPLQTHRQRLYGLTIDPERLAAIRNERRANSRYANVSQCEDEVRLAERLFERNRIPVINTTHISVEEIATKILVDLGLRDHLR